MTKPRRVSAMSQVLKETQQFQAEQEAAQEETPIPTTPKKSDNNSLSQKINTPINQSDNTTSPQVKRKSDERIRKTFYLDPEQPDKLEELRREYRKATGKKLNDQEFLRMVIDKLHIQMLL